MNDLFTHLAARALGAVPAVRPRPVSRFEPLAPARLVMDLPLEADFESSAPPLAPPAAARRPDPAPPAASQHLPAPLPAVFERSDVVRESAGPAQPAVVHGHHIEQPRSVHIAPAESIRPADGVRQPTAIPVLLQRMAIPPVTGPAPVSVRPPAPIINVTIGRIEVRSVPERQQGGQARFSAPPSLTLEQYLQQRKRGRR
jgi:hypothetical protein